MNEYQELVFRPYFIPAAAYDNAIVQGPCIINAIVTTIPGTTNYTYTIFDSVQSAGQIAWRGDLTPVNASGLWMRMFNGVYLQTANGATKAGWVFVIALLS